MGDPIKKLLRGIDRIPTLPETAYRILNLTDDPSVSIDNLKNIVEKDPAISAKILSVANSAFFGFPVRTNMLNDAIMRIGFDNVKNIALGISILSILDDGKRSPYFRKLFSHSVTVGLIARLLSRNLKVGIAEDILIEGLLHDLGYLVLNKYFPETFEILLRALQNSKPLPEVEKDILGFTHAEVGYWIAEQWNLHHTVLDVTLYHHTPSLAKRHSNNVAIIHIADYIACKNILCPIVKDSYYPLDPFSLEMLKIPDDVFRDMEESVGGMPFSDEIFNISDEGHHGVNNSW